MSFKIILPKVTIILILDHYNLEYFEDIFIKRRNKRDSPRKWRNKPFHCSGIVLPSFLQSFVDFFQIKYIS